MENRQTFNQLKNLTDALKKLEQAQRESDRVIGSYLENATPEEKEKYKAFRESISAAVKAGDSARIMELKESFFSTFKK